MVFFHGHIIAKEPNTNPVKREMVLFLKCLKIHEINLEKVIIQKIDPNKNKPKWMSPVV